MTETRIYNKQNFTGYIRGYATTLKIESSDLIITDGYITSNDPYYKSRKITWDYINIEIDK
ncbi:hypothetical protein NAI81_10050 [Francisella tularensis subsp. holarctica]|nr:hypothetical protein [Francisella tularensis]MDE5022753.1 hypothetical protein [Francisella tularensis subsp. holarctica]